MSAARRSSNIGSAARKHVGGGVIGVGGSAAAAPAAARS